MKHVHINTNKMILGWYSKDIHDIIPTPSYEVTEEEWQTAIDNGSNTYDPATKIFSIEDHRTQAEITEQNNALILSQLEEIDRKSIRPLRDGDTVRVQALEAEAEALRAQLI